jgi:hypothetical protein
MRVEFRAWEKKQTSHLHAGTNKRHDSTTAVLMKLRDYFQSIQKV